MKYNVLAGVTEIIEAGSPEDAVAQLDRRLRYAGFEPYDGLADNLPEGYQMAMLSEDQEEPGGEVSNA